MGDKDLSSALQEREEIHTLAEKVRSCPHPRKRVRLKCELFARRREYKRTYGEDYNDPQQSLKIHFLFAFHENNLNLCSNLSF